MSALRDHELLALLQQLTEREQLIVDLVARFRLVQRTHVERLLFQEQGISEASGRHCRRQLARLSELGLLRRLERRVGGVRAGSTGHLYTLAPAGRRLQALTNEHGRPASNRGVHEPGLPFLNHTLAITDLYVRLREAERRGRLELLGFETEPDCWRPYTLPNGASVYVKPDALVRLGIGDWEERSFVELDLATQGHGALTRKVRAYLALFRSGREQAAHGVFPRIAFLTPNQTRARQISAITKANGNVGLFAVGTITNALEILSGQTEAEPQP